MIKKTGDETVIYGVALSRDEDGNLSDISIGATLGQATEHYDNFNSVALLKVTIEVLSSIDGEIQPRKEN